MLGKKWFKRIMLTFLLLIPVLLLLVWELRSTNSLYARHPKKFQVVAEYFCAQTSERSHCFVWRPTPGEDLPDEDWPQEVSDAVHYIFRHSRCRSIIAGQTRTGVSYCQFSDPITSYSQNETGIIYTPREDGQEIFDEVFYPPVAHWNALSDHWFSFTLISYDDYNSGG